MKCLIIWTSMSLTPTQSKRILFRKFAVSLDVSMKWLICFWLSIQIRSERDVKISSWKKYIYLDKHRYEFQISRKFLNAFTRFLALCDKFIYLDRKWYKIKSGGCSSHIYRTTLGRPDIKCEWKEYMLTRTAEILYLELLVFFQKDLLMPTLSGFQTKHCNICTINFFEC